MGEFKFRHKNYQVRFDAGMLTIDEFHPDDPEYDFINTFSISMDDLRDIYREVDSLHRSLNVEKGDRVVLSDEFVKRGGFLAGCHANTVGVVEEVLTEWEEGDPICWDFHVRFGNNVHSNGVYWGDVRKI